MILDDTYDCIMIEEDEDGDLFESEACITLQGIQLIKKVYLSDHYSNCTEITYSDGSIICITDNPIIFRSVWKKFKKSITIHSIN